MTNKNILQNALLYLKNIVKNAKIIAVEGMAKY
jgi:hypothetical protein